MGNWSAAWPRTEASCPARHEEGGGGEVSRSLASGVKRMSLEPRPCELCRVLEDLYSLCRLIILSTDVKNQKLFRQFGFCGPYLHWRWPQTSFQTGHVVSGVASVSLVSQLSDERERVWAYGYGWFRFAKSKLVQIGSSNWRYTRLRLDGHVFSLHIVCSWVVTVK